MHTRYLAMFFSYNTGGFWGTGETLEEAVANLMKEGKGHVRTIKKKGFTKYRFDSTLPFAPSDREATADESDMWVDAGGAMNWLRCVREEIK